MAVVVIMGIKFMDFIPGAYAKTQNFGWNATIFWNFLHCFFIFFDENITFYSVPLCHFYLFPFCIYSIFHFPFSSNFLITSPHHSNHLTSFPILYLVSGSILTYFCNFLLTTVNNAKNVFNSSIPTVISLQIKFNQS